MKNEMRRKLLRSGAFLSFFVMLVGCTIPLRPAYDLTYSNAEYNVIHPQPSKDPANYVVSIPSAYSLADETFPYLDSGLVEVVNSNGYHGMFSVFEKGLAVPCLYTHFSTLESPNGRYVKAFRVGSGENEAMDVYDSFGSLITSSSNYQEGVDDLLVNISTIQDEFRNSVALETLQVNHQIRYTELKKGDQRSSYTPKSFVLSKQSDGTYYPTRSSLKEIGMDSYQGEIQANGSFLAYKDNALASLFTIPKAGVGCFFWKCYFYQFSYEGDAAACDYVQDGKYLRLETAILQVADGKRLFRKFPYVIDSIRPYYDTDAIAHYAIVECHAITSSKTIDPTLKRLVIDNEAGIRNDVSDSAPFSSQTMKMNGSYFYDPASSTVIDGSVAPIATIPYLVDNFNYTFGTMRYKKNGLYGVYGFDGKQLSEPIFKELNLMYCPNNNGLGVGEDGAFYSVTALGNSYRPLSIEPTFGYRDTGYGYFELSRSDYYGYDEDAKLKPCYAYLSYNGDYDYSSYYDFYLANTPVACLNHVGECTVFKTNEEPYVYSMRFVGAE